MMEEVVKAVLCDAHGVHGLRPVWGNLWEAECGTGLQLGLVQRSLVQAYKKNYG